MESPPPTDSTPAPIAGALLRLDELPEADLSIHPQIFDAIHQSLRDALNAPVEG